LTSGPEPAGQVRAICVLVACKAPVDQSGAAWFNPWTPFAAAAEQRLFAGAGGGADERSSSAWEAGRDKAWQAARAAVRGTRLSWQGRRRLPGLETREKQRRYCAWARPAQPGLRRLARAEGTKRPLARDRDVPTAGRGGSWPDSPGAAGCAGREKGLIGT